MINFPNNPKVGDAFTNAGTIYSCVSIAPVVWNAAPADSGIPDAPTDGKNYGRKNAVWTQVSKADVGLPNADNTSDLAKPISTATQAALNTKEPNLAASIAANYYRGDKTWQTLNKAAVGLGSVDNVSDATKTVQSALYLRSGANPAGALIPFTWVDDSTAPTYLWGAGNVNGQVYHYTRVRVGVANSADYASGAGNVNGISGWNYQNRAKNPVYLWATDGSGQDQYLTQPGNITSGRTASVEGAGGGTISGDVAVGSSFWTNGGFIRAADYVQAGSGVYAGGSTTGIAMIQNGSYPYLRFSNDGWRWEWDGTSGTIRFYNSSSVQLMWCGGIGDFNCKYKGHQPGGGLWGDNSDERIKKDIADYTQGLDAILALRPRTYKFIDGIERDDRTFVGLIAQEAMVPMPEMVSVAIPNNRTMGDLTLDDMLALDATPMLYALVNAVKELNAKIEALTP